MLQITSPKNPRVKAAADLMAERRERLATGHFAVEGAREIGQALAAGYALSQLFICPERLSPEARSLSEGAVGGERLQVTAPVFARLAMREDKDGLLAVFSQKSHRLADHVLGPQPLVLAVHGVEKPGNLGALLRSADGAGCDLVVILDGSVDLYNPHVIRGSLGAVFTLKVAVAESAAFLDFCRARQIAVIAAALSPKARPHYEVELGGAAALLLGSEAFGLPPDLVAAADQVAQIPMLGRVDSLNVSAAGAVLLYEARRQRRG